MGPFNFRYYHLNTLPRLRDIVWCCVPDVELGGLGLTVGPALVYATHRDPATGRGAVRIFYGHENLNLPQSMGWDLIIQNAERLDALDLPKAVRFNLGLSNLLPWAEEFFRPPAHSLHIIAGSLNEPEIKRYRAALAKRGIIHAM